MKEATTKRRNDLCVAANDVIASGLENLDLGLASVAETVGCSPRQLQRSFLEAGTTFRQVLLEMRMQRARELVEQSHPALALEKIAPMVGYRKPSGLRQAYRRYWGANPSEHRAATPEYLGSVTFFRS